MRYLILCFILIMFNFASYESISLLMDSSFLCFINRLEHCPLLKHVRLFLLFLGLDQSIVFIRPCNLDCVFLFSGLETRMGHNS